LEKPTLRELSKFDLKTYVKLIKYLGQIYKIVPLCEIPKEDVPYLVLRHDVDISPTAALKMAEIEHGMGVRSTYFIWLSSDHHNSLEGRSVYIIRQICRLGHEIGLHYDTTQYECYGLDDIDALNMEIRVLENLSGRKVKSISCHAPRVPGSFIGLNGYINADDPRLRDIYVHDSRKLWTVKSLFILLNNPPKRVQLLIHPCHWEGKIHMKTRLDEFLQTLLWFLYKLRIIPIRLIHSRESCEN
jgi:hypothetical protein